MNILLRIGIIIGLSPNITNPINPVTAASDEA